MAVGQQLISLKDLHRFDNLEMLARQVVEGFIIGLHKSPYHGFSVEFAEHKIYNPGESIKNVDWKVLARTDRMYTKKYEEETNLRCHVILDASSSMYFPSTEAGDQSNTATKIKFSALCTAAIMHMMKRQRDAVGLSVFSDDIEHHFKAKSSTVHHNLLLATLENAVFNPKLNKATAAAKSIHLLAESIHKRSLVVIFSDMFDGAGSDQDQLFAALQHLKHRKHEVVLFHVVDQALEMEFEFENRPYEFIDMETGDKVKLQSNQVKDYYVEQLSKYKKQLATRCLQYSIDFVEADINKDFRQVLLPYLVKRTKMH